MNVKDGYGRGLTRRIQRLQHRLVARHDPEISLCCPEFLVNVGRGYRVVRLSTHTSQLSADGADMVRVAAHIVDKYGNTLPYQAQSVRFMTEGDAKLIGQNPMPLLAGQGACYVKSRHTVGQVIVSAYADGLPPVSVTLQIA